MFDTTVVLIEDKASGTQLIQDLIYEGISMVTGCKPEGDKVMRLHAQSATIQNGFVHLPREAHWLEDYLHEMLVFPNGRHDDQVDSTAQAIAWTKQRSTNTGMIEFYEREAAKQNGEIAGALVRLRVPHGISHVYLRSGECLSVFDGSITVPKSEVGSLHCAGFVRWEGTSRET